MPQLEQLLEKFPTDVRVVFKNFPIRSHKYAIKAAMASLAAGRQDKFWEFHDELFKNYNRLNDQKIQEISKELGLDQTKFNEDQKSPVEAARIRQDYEEGIRLGVRGTPTVFINGKRLKNRSLQNMEANISEELKSKKEWGMDSILKEFFRQDLQDYFDRFPEENGQTLSPSAKSYIPNYSVGLITIGCDNDETN